MHGLPSIDQAVLRLLHWVAPRSCGACGTLLPFRNDLFCDECHALALQTPPAAVTSLEAFPVVAVAHYRPPWSLAIRNFKYSNRSDLAGPLAREMWQAVSPLLTQSVVLVPVPMHPKRLCERGYNQSTLLAHRLARLASSTVDVATLSRTTHTNQQARLSREDRARNLQHTMQASTWRHSKPVVLVDDVLTTGATLLECARVLSASGAKILGACVIAVASTAAGGTSWEDLVTPRDSLPESDLGLL